MSVAQAATVWAPESFRTTTSGPGVNDGGSFTATTGTMSVASPVCAPAPPEFPRSFTETRTRTVPWWSGTGVSVEPDRAAFNCASVPRNANAELPSRPDTGTAPPVESRRRVPSRTWTAISRTPEPASGSRICQAPRRTDESSATDGADGGRMRGVSLVRLTSSSKVRCERWVPSPASTVTVVRPPVSGTRPISRRRTVSPRRSSTRAAPGARASLELRAVTSNWSSGVWSSTTVKVIRTGPSSRAERVGMPEMTGGALARVRDAPAVGTDCPSKEATPERVTSPIAEAGGIAE